ncbi:M67 family metallopeptidase [Anaerolineae bacterium CFX7]|nr:M67 family metallopeptidase [Anaerolineae bacterium CFX7]
MILTRSQLDELYAQMRRAAPHEMCGLLGGKDGRALKIYPIKNIAPQRAKNYLMDGAEQIRAMQDMDANGYDILAIYHSHPATRAYPSPTDLRDAWDTALQAPRYPGTIYLILSLRNPDMPKARGYFLNGETITAAPLEIVADNQ